MYTMFATVAHVLGLGASPSVSLMVYGPFSAAGARRRAGQGGSIDETYQGRSRQGGAIDMLRRRHAEPAARGVGQSASHQPLRKGRTTHR